MSLIVVTDDTDRDGLAEAIGHLNHRAKREMPKVEQFTTDEPTPWTCKHRAINDLLDSLELLEAKVQPKESLPCR